MHLAGISFRRTVMNCGWIGGVGLRRTTCSRKGWQRIVEGGDERHAADRLTRNSTVIASVYAARVTQSGLVAPGVVTHL
jgi:hypothetical protein